MSVRAAEQCICDKHASAPFPQFGWPRRALRCSCSSWLPSCLCLRAFAPPATQRIPQHNTLQTHSELAETRAELEQLADDILAIKMLMDEESALGAAPAGAQLGSFCGL